MPDCRPVAAAIAVFAALACLPSPSAAQASQGVCDREQPVQDAILAAVSGVSDCADITADHLSGITILELQSKSVTDLPVGSFSGMTGLLTLRLEDNQIRDLPLGLFDDLTRLTSLQMNNNRISALPAGLFDNLTRLEQLHFRNNNVSSLPENIFSSLGNLIAMNPCHNPLMQVPAGVFAGLTKLRRLFLAANQLTSVPAGLFDDLTSLNFLEMNGNDLTTLPAGLFDNLPNLDALHLDLNPLPLTVLPASIFYRNPKLAELRLDEPNFVFFTSHIRSALYPVDQPITALVLPATVSKGAAPAYRTENLPPGLSFDAATRTLSGTPTQTGSYNLLYTASAGGLTASETIPISVQSNVTARIDTESEAVATMPAAIALATPAFGISLSNALSQAIVGRIQIAPAASRTPLLTPNGFTYDTVAGGDTEFGFGLWYQTGERNLATDRRINSWRGQLDFQLYGFDFRTEFADSILTAGLVDSSVTGTVSAAGNWRLSMTGRAPYVGWRKKFTNPSATAGVWLSAGSSDGRLHRIGGGASELMLETLLLGASGSLQFKASKFEGQIENRRAETTFQQSTSLSAMQSDTNQTRLAVQWSYDGKLGRHNVLKPKLELGRLVGDAEVSVGGADSSASSDTGSVTAPTLSSATRAAADTGNADEWALHLYYLNIKTGLSLELGRRNLQARGRNSYIERSSYVRLHMARRFTGRGFSFSLSSGYGGIANDTQELWENGGLYACSCHADDDRQGQNLNARLDYGMPTGTGRLLSWYLQHQSIHRHSRVLELGQSLRIRKDFHLSLSVSRVQQMQQAQSLEHNPDHQAKIGLQANF